MTGLRKHATSIAAACGAVLLTTAASALAQNAPPSSRPSGILGPQDRRVQIPSEQWPWTAIGRVNVVVGNAARGLCTGTLIAPQLVLTAAHCLFNARTNDWVRPGSVHFVLGQTREKFLAHSQVASFVIPPQLKFKLEDRARHDMIAPDMIRHDWAILKLRDALEGRPIPVEAVTNADLPPAGGGGEIALAGYAADHPYVLSMHKGCQAQIDSPEPGVVVHRCDSVSGESGAPILLLRDGRASVIGIHTTDSQRFTPQVGYQALAALGAAAAEFKAAVEGRGGGGASGRENVPFRTDSPARPQ
jgi:protease YdgD